MVENSHEIERCTTIPRLIGNALNVSDQPKSTPEFATQDETTVLRTRIRTLESIVVMERQLRRAMEASQRVSSDSIANASKRQPPAVRDDNATQLVTSPHRAPVANITEAVADTLAVRPQDPQLVPGESVQALPVGFRLHEYRIDAVLGQGGFGITYLATDVHLNAKVAIKEYLPGSFAYRTSDRSVTPRWADDREFYQHGLDSFLVEARTLATFRHPNIVRVVRFFEAHRTAYIVMEYERGESLKTWWPKQSALSEAELIELLHPLFDGLEVVHKSGFLHRDIKPENIYVRHEDGSLVLLDFGSARQAASTQRDLTNAVTPGYAAIEQYDGGEQGPWTDIHALGATLYWMLTGAKPVPAPKRKKEELPIFQAGQAALARYSSEFLHAINWALKLNPKDRPQNIQAFQQALFINHSSRLSLQDALRARDADAVMSESWRALAISPRLLKARLTRILSRTAKPGSWPLMAKITGAMIFAALLPMIITSYYNFNQTLASTSTSELRRLEQIAEGSAGQIFQLTDNVRSIGTYLSTDSEFIAFLSKQTEAGAVAIQSKVDNIANANADIDLVMVMDRNGNALVSNNSGVTGHNFRFRNYMMEALSGRPYMTGIIVGSTIGMAGVYYAHPLRNADDTVIGAVVLRIKINTIERILSKTGQSGLTPMLINGDGILIYHPDAKHLYQSLVPLSDGKQAEMRADQRFRRDKIESLNMQGFAQAVIRAAGVGNVSYQSVISGMPEIAGYAPVKGHTWVVAVSETRHSFEAPLNKLFHNVLYSVIAVGLVFLILALLFTRNIVRPIEQLMAAVHALKGGDYSKAMITVKNDDEIGRLTRTFNVMIDVLRQRDREQKRKTVRLNVEDSDPLGLNDSGR